MGTSKPGYGYRSLTFQQCNLAHTTSPETIQSASFKLCGSSRTLKLEALRAIIKMTLILVSLDLVKVFISQKSLGFSKSCRQRVIIRCFGASFPEFAIYPFPCGCLVESLVFRGPRCLVFVQLDPDHPGSPPFWNKVYTSAYFDFS